LRSTRFLLFGLVLGLGAVVVVGPHLWPSLSFFAATPSAIFWLVLTLAVTVLPVRGMAGVGSLNISPLPLMTMLLLYGTQPALLAAWLSGFTATLSSRSESISVDIHRALLNSGKHALCILAAGYVLWGTVRGPSGMTAGSVSNQATILRLLLAHGSYFVLSTTILSFGLWLRDSRNPLEIWRANFGWGALLSWSTPLGAYLLAVFYLNGGLLLIGILVAIGLVGILTVRDHVRIRSSFINLVEALRLARDGNMPHLKGDTQKVVELSMALGRKMRLPMRSLEILEQAATLHNVGYIAVDRTTVLKPDRLTDEELSEIRQHPESGMRILREVARMGGVAEVVHCHHENPDGTGYPRKLKSPDIPIEAAIIKAAEAFVAITSPRPHREKIFTKDEALERIAEIAGHSVDPLVAYHLCELMGRQDLARQVSGGFGPPTKGQIKERLYKSKPKPWRFFPAKRPARKAIITGLAMVGGCATLICILGYIKVLEPLHSGALEVQHGILGGLFFLFLLGLAALKPVRLPWGAYVSASTAIVFPMAVAGGPLYAVVFGLAAIAWAMVHNPRTALSPTRDFGCGIANGYNGYNGWHSKNGYSRNGNSHSERPKTEGDGTDSGFHHEVPGITSLIKHKALATRLSTASSYGFVLILAGCVSWGMYEIGGRIADASGLHRSVAELIPFFLSVSTFYLMESMAQVALLARSGLSPRRLWQRNYLKVFPEPLTYAICGYAIVLSNDMLGLWAAVPLFLFPTFWRHLALLRRLHLLETKDSLIRSIARAIDEKDRYTGGHSASVVEFSVAIAREMGKSEPFVEELEEAAIRHDLGKVSWPSGVLRKPGALDEKEEEDYKWTHPDRSAEIAAKAGSAAAVTEMIMYHHERVDGRGYPHRLAGDRIPLGARILCVADAFDAMIHDRWYRRKRDLQDAIDELVRCAGTQFDPGVVEAFKRVIDKTDLDTLVEAVEEEVTSSEYKVLTGV
jgi:HD-GYP domain-containing protein (c-di-GMP phosphodiesterase class II)